MAMAKSIRVVPATVKDIMLTSVNFVRLVTTHVISMASKLVAHPTLRSRLVGYVLLALVMLAVVSLSRFQLWMAGAGLVMVVLSVTSAVQEFKFSKTVPSYQDFLNKGMEKCSTNMITLPHLSPLQNSTAKKLQQHVSKEAMSSMTLNIASSTSSSNSHFPLTLQEKTKRRESEDSIGAMESAINTTIVDTPHPSNMAIEGNNKLNVLHCGTVIDIQGSHGFIIPHDLGVETHVLSKPACSDAVVKAEKMKKMPLIIPFNLSEEQTGARQEITVGKTVEFAFSHATATTDSSTPICARNVTPVPSNDGIVKSRFALQSCKQAREVSFARAMEELTMISPRNVPVKHHVDLIKYAENLDDHDTLFD